MAYVPQTASKPYADGSCTYLMGSYGSVVSNHTLTPITYTDIYNQWGTAFGSIVGGKFRFTRVGYYRFTSNVNFTVVGDAFFKTVVSMQQLLAGEDFNVNYYQYGTPPYCQLQHYHPQGIFYEGFMMPTGWAAQSVSIVTYIEQVY